MKRTTALASVFSLIVGAGAAGSLILKNEGVSAPLTRESPKTLPVSEGSESLKNVLSCLSPSEGEERYNKLTDCLKGERPDCLKGERLPSTISADQISDVLGSIPTHKIYRRLALDTIFQNSGVTLSARDALQLLEDFSDISQRTLATNSMACRIQKPISASDERDFLRGVDNLWISGVKQKLRSAEPCPK